MNYVNSRFALFVVALFALNACGAGDDEFEISSDEEFDPYEESFDVSDLPNDFPAELIPPTYDVIQYLDSTNYTGIEHATFESNRPVRLAVDHYTSLLGEPTLNTGSTDDDNGQMVQWQKTPYSPWVVGILGDDSETIVSVSKPQSR